MLKGKTAKLCNINKWVCHVYKKLIYKIVLVNENLLACLRQSQSQHFDTKWSSHFKMLSFNVSQNRNSCLIYSHPLFFFDYLMSHRKGTMQHLTHSVPWTSDSDSRIPSWKPHFHIEEKDMPGANGNPHLRTFVAFLGYFIVENICWSFQFRFSRRHKKVHLVQSANTA